jgi:hypothetical protein
MLCPTEHYCQHQVRPCTNICMCSLYWGTLTLEFVSARPVYLCNQSSSAEGTATSAECKWITHIICVLAFHQHRVHVQIFVRPHCTGALWLSRLFFDGESYNSCRMRMNHLYYLCAGILPALSVCTNICTSPLYWGTLTLKFVPAGPVHLCNWSSLTEGIVTPTECEQVTHILCVLAFYHQRIPRPPRM